MSGQQGHYDDGYGHHPDNGYYPDEQNQGYYDQGQYDQGHYQGQPQGHEGEGYYDESYVNLDLSTNEQKLTYLGVTTTRTPVILITRTEAIMKDNLNRVMITIMNSNITTKVLLGSKLINKAALVEGDTNPRKIRKPSATSR